MMGYRDYEPRDTDYEHDLDGDLSDNDPKLVLVLALPRNYLNKMGYPVVVEMYERVVGRGASGSKRRRYQTEFTEKERKVIARYYRLFYRWYLVSGTPDHVHMKFATLELLKRAIAFFATV